jgi:hypothetical protein
VFTQIARNTIFVRYAVEGIKQNTTGTVGSCFLIRWTAYDVESAKYLVLLLIKKMNQDRSSAKRPALQRYEGV